MSDKKILLQLLGYQGIKTTTVFTHVMQQKKISVKSPLDV